MTINKTLYGRTRRIPETRERPWGNDVSDLLEALTAGMDGMAFLSGTTLLWRLSAASVATLAGSATLTPTASWHRISGSGGAVTLNATTAIADITATGGTVLLLTGQSDTNTVTIPNAANTALNGNVTLANGESLLLIWDSTSSLWREIGRSH